MKIFGHNEGPQLQFCERCGSVSDAAARAEAAREAAQLKTLMLNGWRLV